MLLSPLEVDTMAQSTLNTVCREQILEGLTEKHYFLIKYTSIKTEQNFEVFVALSD